MVHHAYARAEAARMHAAACVWETPMPYLGTREAAALAGKDRSTILRAIKSGHLSATRDGGGYLIDPAELERAFGALRHVDASAEAVPPLAYADAARATAEREVELLREMLDRERHSYERDRRTWEEERTFLRGMLDKQSEQMRLLTDQRERDQARSPSLFRWFRRAS
jgi:excisionase family DNA binding protein